MSRGLGDVYKRQTNSLYVPYQFVYFEAVDIEVSDLEEITPIYSFHDDTI